MKKLSDNIIMSNAYCEITECGDIENCEKCVELNILEHDKQIRADAIDECIKFIKDHSSRAFIDSDGWGCTDNDREDIFKLFWLDDLEQLKEQNGKNNNQS